MAFAIAQPILRLCTASELAAEQSSASSATDIRRSTTLTRAGVADALATATAKELLV
jgi:hypothetical protein